MRKPLKYIQAFFILTTSIFVTWLSFASFSVDSNKFNVSGDYFINPPDTDKPELIYPLEDKDPLSPRNNNALYLKTPKIFTEETEYNPETKEYKITRKIGNRSIGTPTYMSYEDYLNYDVDNAILRYWKEKTGGISAGKKGGLIPEIHIGNEAFDRIFGSNTIDIRPQGSAELIFGVRVSRREDPALDVRQRTTANFDFQEKIQMNVTAKIGDKISFGVNYNTEATFEFDNKMKLEYVGDEDEIIKKIEAGNVTLPLNGTLITGNQSLFGIKTELQFGKTTVTTVFSQQKSESKSIEVQGGAQMTKFKLKADQYEENRHFFIAQYFRDHYEEFLSKLPLVSSPITITKIEVWVTSKGPATQEARNIIAFQDLGEKNPYRSQYALGNTPPYPDNEANSLYSYINTPSIRDINQASNILTSPSYGLVSGIDFEKVQNARKLSPNEYTFNSKLGFISLNTSLNPDEVLAVAFQYKIIGDDSTYQVGDFSTDGINSPQALFVKLLKGTAQNPRIPLWKLMMRNVYSLGAYQISNQDFRLHVLYSNDENGIPVGYLSEGNISGIPLIRVLGMDKINTQYDPVPDGVFDFIDNAATTGGTVNSKNGRIYFPVLEPFGRNLRQAIGDDMIANKYVFQELYDSTKTIAQQFPEKNKFYIMGSYKSSAGSDISLNAMNIPQGSVVVTSGGIKLTENVDYTVDYTLGRVKIINQAILESGNPIKISLESNSLFNIQTKRLLGMHVDHKLSKDFNIGGTILNLTESPLTQKVNIGEDPISNTIWGLDGQYQINAPLITKLVDKLPFISTKEQSKLTISGEFAHLIPGHSRAIGSSGTVYIDDFEGSKSKIDIKNQGAWKLASTPQKQTAPGMFPEAAPNTGLKYNYNRALLAWYVIDRVFNEKSSQTPEHIWNDKEQRSNHYVREVLETEVFPNADPKTGTPMNIAVLNLSYYPRERGPYNYDVEGSEYSFGIDSAGYLKEPATRWGGIMRKLETTDFEATNIEYLEFWLMDPFIYSNGQNGNPLHSGGELYINLGDISEDVLRDGRQSYENGLPTSENVTNVDTTIWGRVPTIQALVNSFDNNVESRKYQDVGLDGLGDNDERSFFNGTFLERIKNKFGVNSLAYQKALTDPSADNYHYYLGTDYDNQKLSVLERYKRYNGVDGNSPTSEQSPEDYPTQATNLPDVEDINKDNTLSETERYFQYRIKLKPEEMVVGKNYINDVLVATKTLPNGTTSQVKWYQFKVPLSNPDAIIGDIHDFKSIRFIRMFLKGFSEDIHLRFATLDLVRSEWRKYNYSLLEPGEYIPTDDINQTTFNVSAVSIEENGNRVPINYVLPPTIEREVSWSTTNLTQLNEQSLSLEVCNLLDGDARAVYKITDFDMRKYNKLKMFVHAEAERTDMPLKEGDLTIFVRLGTDFTSNYYEYEIPLVPTEWGETDPYRIWPEENSFDIDFSKLLQAKLNRNVKMREPNSNITLNTPYYEYDGKNKITVVGTPNLSGVKTIMIGVRNPKKRSLEDNDDGLSKCAEIWVNELRLTDFNEKGGWATNTRVSTNLADLGNVALATHYATAGFGSIEQKLDERSKFNVFQYDIAASFELGKFFSEKTGLKIPMHVDFSENFTNPEYHPLDPDLYFKDALESYKDEKQRDSIKKICQDYTRRKSINFVNVKKNKVPKAGKISKPHIYDIENLDFTYAYTELYHSNIDIEYNMEKTYKGAIGYNFTHTPKNYAPFEKIKPISKIKALRLIKDFNFYLMPKMLTFRTDMDRRYAETLLRDITPAKVILEPTVVKLFTWNRTYGLRFDLTKGLQLDFNASTIARIDEPPGVIDENNYQHVKDSIISNIKRLGRTTNYNHTGNINYNIPINKIGLLNWITANAKYTATYSWTAAPLATAYLGNTIENSNTKQLNGQLNFTTLYNKVKFLKNLSQPQKTTPPSKMKTSNPTLPSDVDEDTIKKPSFDYVKFALETFARLLTCVKNASITWSETEGTLIPGYMPTPKILGQDWNIDAPGTEFIFGSQKDIRQKIIDNGWITTDSLFNSAYVTRYSNNFSARTSIEPLPSFKIELTANRNYTKNHQEYYKNGEWGKSPTDNGNFTISTITWFTAFMKDDEYNRSPIFEEMKKNRLIVAKRLAENNPLWNGNFVDSTGYPDGYGPTSRDVIVRTFTLTYAKKNLETADLDLFTKIPLPNWRITYDGLSKIEFIKKYIKNFTIGHSYRSTYSIGSFTSNVNFIDPDKDGFTEIRDAAKNYVPQFEIAQVSIMEQFAPLVSLDMTWVNSLLTKIDFKRSRNLTFSLTNNQLTEVASSEITVGLGYRIKDFSFIVKSGGAKKVIKSDLNIKCDLSIRTNKTALRKLDEDVNQVSSGQQTISINTSADYQLSPRFTIRAFFDKIISNPFVSSQFPNSNTNAGISVRFSLAQ